MFHSELQLAIIIRLFLHSYRRKCFDTTAKLTVVWMIYLSIYLLLHSPLLNFAGFFSFLNIYTVGRTASTGDQPIAKPLPTHRTTQTQNKRIHTSMPWVGFESTIPVFERAKTFHALDRAATLFVRLDGSNVQKKKKKKEHNCAVIQNNKLASIQINSKARRFLLTPTSFPLLSVRTLLGNDSKRTVE
jgi:hypothetical protein